jgi:dTDP-4-amino-4,6-dideoxygalactose transaminase
MALELGLAAMGLGPGDEVIVPAVSFVATLGAVLRVGATPVVVDVRADGPWIDQAAVRAACSSKTAAIIPVHLFGVAARLEGGNVPVLDDACQAVAPGGPSFGLCTALSFYPTKVLGGLGEGGMVLTDDAALAKRLTAMRQHGSDHTGRVVEVGGTNGRLDAVSAAVLRARMPLMESELTRRSEIAKAYDAVVGGYALRRPADTTMSTYVLLHPQREAVRESLAGAGIPSAVYYPWLVHDHPAIRDRVLVPSPLLNATEYCSQTLALPCHGGLSDDDVARVVHALQVAL